KLEGVVADPATYRNCFRDVATDWYAAPVCYAKEQGWVSGYGDETFRPAQQVNRAEALTMIVAARSYQTPTPSADLFLDVRRSDWFAPFVGAALTHGLIAPGGHLNPGELLSRGEVSEYLYRALTQDPQLSGQTPAGPAQPATPSSPTQPAAPAPPAGALILPPASGGALSAVWAQEGGTKVPQEVLLARTDPAKTRNSVWNGEQVSLFGGRNEVVNFALMLESADSTANNLSVVFNELAGPNGARISTTSTADLFNWTQRDIELFHVGYLPIKGLSGFCCAKYDERHIPEDLQRPYDPANGIGTGGWTDRPYHDLSYPDIAAPLEVKTPFSIKRGQSQEIWVDIYIPKDLPAGRYTGSISVMQSGSTIAQLPIEVEVKNFTLPDTPSSKTMVVISDANINTRFLGESYPSAPDLVAASEDIINEFFKLAHRHKISLIGAESTRFDRPLDDWIPRLSGALFTALNGYRGPGEGVGNNVYSIGTYSSWVWKGQGEEVMQQKADAWESWFQANAPSVERFLYLIDESDDYALIDKWARWIENSPGPGKNLLSFATVWIGDAMESMPHLDIAASTLGIVETQPAQQAADYLTGRSDKRLYMYNGSRPAQGSFQMEDDGVALRELAWGQYKKNVDRWFYWESTYYNNYQAGAGNTDLFHTAHTFGGDARFDPSLGRTGANYSNGDGVLFYPGTDTVFPQDSLGLDGPLASLRIKFWRRGIQDVDYLTLAKAKDPVRTAEIVNRIVPKVLWEYGVDDPSDPTWKRTPISWSTDPDVWEQARAELAALIAGE
ncbi:hypothetical protein CO046_00415, partial [Candidatus Peregrinibacteria bacterium CG_4_9_14_0_2_um_filter_53_11]